VAAGRAAPPRRYQGRKRNSPTPEGRAVGQNRLGLLQPVPGLLHDNGTGHGRPSVNRADVGKRAGRGKGP